MDFSPKKQPLPAAENLLALVPGAAAMIVSKPGQVKASLENTGAAAADDPVMQFNI
jgi:hypothetical protein